jgi:hypothetical protein
MIDNTEETSGKSLGISEPGTEGVAGPSREVSQRDQIVSGAENAGQEENSELEWSKLHVKEEPAPVKKEPVPQSVRTVFRKTELHGTTTASTPDEGKKPEGGRCRASKVPARWCHISRSKPRSRISSAPS